MPTQIRKSPKGEFADGEVVQCVSPFAHAHGALAGGERRRVDDLVRATPQHWIKDGATTAEIGAKIAALYEFREEPPPAPPAVPVERRLCDKDAVIDIRTGDRLAKSLKIVRKDPDQFVPVIPAGLRREDAVVARQNLSIVGEGGEVERIVYAGTLIHKDDPLAKLHPLQVELPGREV